MNNISLNIKVDLNEKTNVIENIITNIFSFWIFKDDKYFLRINLVKEQFRLSLSEEFVLRETKAKKFQVS